MSSDVCRLDRPTPRSRKCTSKGVVCNSRFATSSIFIERTIDIATTGKQPTSFQSQTLNTRAHHGVNQQPKRTTQQSSAKQEAKSRWSIIIGLRRRSRNFVLSKRVVLFSQLLLRLFFGLSRENGGKGASHMMIE